MKTSHQYDVHCLVLNGCCSPTPTPLYDVKANTIGVVASPSFEGSSFEEE